MSQLTSPGLTLVDVPEDQFRALLAEGGITLDASDPRWTRPNRPFRTAWGLAVGDLVAVARGVHLVWRQTQRYSAIVPAPQGSHHAVPQTA